MQASEWTKAWTKNTSHSHARNGALPIFWSLRYSDPVIRHPFTVIDHPLESRWFPQLGLPTHGPSPLRDELPVSVVADVHWFPPLASAHQPSLHHARSISVNRHWRSGSRSFLGVLPPGPHDLAILRITASLVLMLLCARTLCRTMVCKADGTPNGSRMKLWFGTQVHNYKR